VSLSQVSQSIANLAADFLLVHLGAGLELFGVVSEDRTDGPITVSIELRGTPRNMSSDADAHSARVGVEFAEPSESAKRYMRMLNGVKSRW
jgi:hypothetical protein